MQSGSVRSRPRQLQSSRTSTVSIGDASVWEGTGFPVTASFAVTLRTAAQEAVSVAYTVTAGTATAGVDYTGASSGTLSFAVGQTTKFVTQSVVGDATVEPSETFTVGLSNPTNAILGDATGLGTIRNDDGSPAPNLAVSDATVNEGDSGTRTVQLEIRAQANAFPINVNYSVVRGSAEDADFVATPPQTLQLTGPNTLRTFSVKPDLLKEGDEKFGVYVWSATMARLDAAASSRSSTTTSRPRRPVRCSRRSPPRTSGPRRIRSRPVIPATSSGRYRHRARSRRARRRAPCSTGRAPLSVPTSRSPDG